MIEPTLSLEAGVCVLFWDLGDSPYLAVLRACSCFLGLLPVELGGQTWAGKFLTCWTISPAPSLGIIVEGLISSFHLVPDSFTGKEGLDMFLQETRSTEVVFRSCEFLLCQSRGCKRLNIVVARKETR